RCASSQYVDIFHELAHRVPQLEEDLEALGGDTERINALAEAVRYLIQSIIPYSHPNKMVTSCGQSRSNDISGLKEMVLYYTAQEEEGRKLEPTIPHGAKKRSRRGFKHPQLARLLCPIKHLDNFNQNPKEFQQLLINGKVKVRARDMPSFLWEKETYDPDDITYGMFRNPVLVMVFKHIFTSPSSAIAELPGQTKTRSSQAKKNEMKTVTPWSICYICVLYRHSISGVDDWRHDDRLRKCEDFYQHLRKVWEDAADTDPEWLKDTIEWWNAAVLGIDPEVLDLTDNEEGPSTISMIHRQRCVRLMRQQALEEAAAAAANAEQVQGHLTTPSSSSAHQSLPPSGPSNDRPPLPTPQTSFCPSPPLTQQPSQTSSSTQAIVTSRNDFPPSGASSGLRYEDFLDFGNSHPGWKGTEQLPQSNSQMHAENAQYFPGSNSRYGSAGLPAHSETYHAQPSFGPSYQRPVLADYNHAVR
ncbi:hypothetical protein CVT26_013095, partial [Gymnopilus dilepis]